MILNVFLALLFSRKNTVREYVQTNFSREISHLNEKYSVVVATLFLAGNKMVDDKAVPSQYLKKG